MNADKNKEAPQGGTSYSMALYSSGRRTPERIRKQVHKAMQAEKYKRVLDKTDKGNLDLAFSVIETAAIHLHNGLPLFLEGDLFTERNEWLRESLIRALLLSLDLLRREGAEVEETPLLELVRRVHTSETENENNAEQAERKG